ncbi:MAG: hypothetical protein ABJL67_15680 [Sulfitobacter sp.]
MQQTTTKKFHADRKTPSQRQFRTKPWISPEIPYLSIWKIKGRPRSALPGGIVCRSYDEIVPLVFPFLGEENDRPYTRSAHISILNVLPF